jgi:hypothetical protein
MVSLTLIDNGEDLGTIGHFLFHEMLLLDFNELNNGVPLPGVMGMPVIPTICEGRRVKV